MSKTAYNMVEEPQDFYVGLRLGEDLLRKINAVKDEEARSRAYVIRALLWMGLRQYEKDGKLPRPQKSNPEGKGSVLK